MWYIEQEMFILRLLIEIRDEPARPDPAMMIFDGLFLS